MADQPRRGVATVADLRARSIIDPVTGCWHWQCAKAPDGLPRIWTFCHHVGDKRLVSGPEAVWNIAHGESPRPMLVFRRCGCSDCVNPVHMKRARDKAEIGEFVRLAGWRKGINVDTNRANLVKARAAAGITETPAEIVLAIRAAPTSITGAELAALYGISPQSASRIRRVESRKQVQGVTP